MGIERNESRMKRYTCTICGRVAEYDGPLPAVFPFCSERCKLVDLGRWFREQYTVEREIAPADADAGVPGGPRSRPE